MPIGDVVTGCIDCGLIKPDASLIAPRDEVTLMPKNPGAVVKPCDIKEVDVEVHRRCPIHIVRMIYECDHKVPEPNFAWEKN
jgi:hypothetical protein